MPRTRGKVEVSLFPFLSVLCCMIGVFMLFLVAILSTRVIDAEGKEVPPPPPPDHVGKTANDNPESIDADTYRALEQRLIELTGQLASRHAERDELGRRLESLRAAIDAKRDELAAGKVLQRRPVELDKPDPVRPVPDPNFRVAKKPVYIEVSMEGYLVQPDKKQYPPLGKKRVGKDESYTASREFKQFLDKVDQSRQQQYLLILVHPNGAEGYRSLRRFLLQEYYNEEKVQRGLFIYTQRKSRIDVGYEPFSKDWQFVAEQSEP